MEGFEIAVMRICLEAIESLCDAVQGCFGMAFGLLEVSKILVLDPDILGVVGFHRFRSPIRSEQSRKGRCTRLLARKRLRRRDHPFCAKLCLIGLFDPAVHDASALGTECLQVARRRRDGDVFGHGRCRWPRRLALQAIKVARWTRAFRVFAPDFQEGPQL